MYQWFLRRHKKRLQEKLDELEMFCNTEGDTTVEIQGEIQALKLALNKSDAET